MIRVEYPEHIQAQLDQLDEKIAEIYAEELPKKDGVLFCNVQERERKKRQLYERIRPLIDEKVRLIQNSYQKYIFERWEVNK